MLISKIRFIWGNLLFTKVRPEQLHFLGTFFLFPRACRFWTILCTCFHLWRTSIRNLIFYLGQTNLHICPNLLLLFLLRFPGHCSGHLSIDPRIIDSHLHRIVVPDLTFFPWTSLHSSSFHQRRYTFLFHVWDHLFSVPYTCFHWCKPSWSRHSADILKPMWLCAFFYPIDLKQSGWLL